MAHPTTIPHPNHSKMHHTFHTLPLYYSLKPLPPLPLLILLPQPFLFPIPPHYLSQIPFHSFNISFKGIHSTSSFMYVYQIYCCKYGSVFFKIRVWTDLVYFQKFTPVFGVFLQCTSPLT